MQSPKETTFAESALMILYSNLQSFSLSSSQRLLTLLVATKDSATSLENLLLDLRQQDPAFMEILFIDSSADPSSILTLLNNFPLPLRFYHGQDFSIYHALNIGLVHLTTEYYSVCGSDDRVFSGYSRSIRSCIADQRTDIAVFPVMTDDTSLFVPKLRNSWLNCTDIPHAVGAVIRKSLHDRFGVYSNRYPICADKYFLAKCIVSGASVSVSACPIGTYGQNGMSSREIRLYIVDLFNIQVALGRNYSLQLLLLIFRLFRYWKACSYGGS